MAIYALFVFFVGFCEAGVVASGGVAGAVVAAGEGAPVFGFEGGEEAGA